ncbi:ATP-grasp domain-containing protein [Jeotgalicoccus sp. ATCC 8456]|uniref:ATP-grasp domain-containing protein n=1 Tax=Jeotgalicoccus sp. ATCC 8456 TaxID=946435 RepID=UPI0018E5D71E|nr:ATP-grasp domain-containing protein [Jeotgalicoccus sp. ATCC 8456]QQD85650.1 ATP-grasp domain-containing protein [Jeotgalicoccus sp. ATCC 8456]
MDKVATEQYLKERNIRTPLSNLYDPDDAQKAFEETFINGDEVVVVKPSTSTLGRGVVVGVKKDAFFEAWEYANEVKLKDKKIIVQEYLTGFEAKATVIQGELHSMVLRVPPYVIGNGKYSISYLINKKNEERESHSHLKIGPIPKNERIKSFLKSQNLSLNYIPKKGEYVLLVSVSNFSLGGELVNITDMVSDHIKENVLKAIAAMPGLYTGGLDVMMKNFDDPDPVILEINSFPALSLATYPTYGKLDNPFKLYVESIVAVDQFLNPRQENYDIDNSNDYIRNLLNFNNLRNEVDHQRTDL